MRFSAQKTKKKIVGDCLEGNFERGKGGGGKNETRSPTFGGEQSGVNGDIERGRLYAPGGRNPVWGNGLQTVGRATGEVLGMANVSAPSIKKNKWGKMESKGERGISKNERHGDGYRTGVARRAKSL